VEQTQCQQSWYELQIKTGQKDGTSYSRTSIMFAEIVIEYIIQTITTWKENILSLVQ